VGGAPEDNPPAARAPPRLHQPLPIGGRRCPGGTHRQRRDPEPCQKFRDGKRITGPAQHPGPAPKQRLPSGKTAHQSRAILASAGIDPRDLGECLQPWDELTGRVRPRVDGGEFPQVPVGIGIDTQGPKTSPAGGLGRSPGTGPENQQWDGRRHDHQPAVKDLFRNPGGRGWRLAIPQCSCYQNGTSVSSLGHFPTVWTGRGHRVPFESC